MIQNGTVSVITKNRYGFGMKIDGVDKWFNSKFEIKAQKGDVVEFDDGDKNYIQELNIVSSAPPVESSSTNSSTVVGNQWKFPIAKDEHGISICRRSAIESALSFLTLNKTEKSGPTMIEEVIEFADIISDYTTGQGDPIEDVKDGLTEQEAALKALADSRE